MKKSDKILFENENLVVINKDSGELTVPDRFRDDIFNLFSSLSEKYGKIYTVHRLDKETSGAIIFAKNAETHRNLSLQFQNRKVEKIYNTVVQHRVYVDEDKITKKILKKPNSNIMLISAEGKDATTHYTVIERFREYTQLAVRIESGRTHQIRVHMQSIGHPLAVDSIYGGKEAIYISDIKVKNFNESREMRSLRPLISRVTLHAEKLSFHLPSSGERKDIIAPFPKDYRALINQLNKWGK